MYELHSLGYEVYKRRLPTLATRHGGMVRGIGRIHDPTTAFICTIALAANTQL